ncbi:hypothetical protein CBER1_10442 [Cercospora berteroae]|uniref:Uncharacterized protein n=1 Tax=Cercospora berteroae TaxID=357750 RepID=A0A2S6CGI0_9PEZI|nr:hypothetical protein CBER1_10442 [Cercospora berteroae]
MFMGYYGGALADAKPKEEAQQQRPVRRWQSESLRSLLYSEAVRNQAKPKYIELDNSAPNIRQKLRRCADSTG